MLGQETCQLREQSILPTIGINQVITGRGVQTMQYGYLLRPTSMRLAVDVIDPGFAAGDSGAASIALIQNMRHGTGPIQSTHHAEI